jgi:uncharacterized repeat protein (TIGR01451 family)
MADYIEKEPSGSLRGFRGPIWFGVALLVVIGGILAFYFLTPSQGLNVAISLTTNPGTLTTGDQFTLSASFSNNSGSVLKGAVIAVVLPADVYSVDNPSARVVEASLGDVSAGASSHEDFQLAAVGAPNTVEHFTGKLTYGETGSSASFEADNNLDVAVGAVPAVGVEISAPPSAISGVNIPITVTYQNTTDHPIQNLSISMQYPPAFNFLSASSSLSTADNTTWSLGMLPASASGTILINGNIVGATNASYPFEADLRENFSDVPSQTLTAHTANVVLGMSPLSFSIALNNASNTIAQPGQIFNYALSYTNNSDVAFQNAVITAHVAGGMFNLGTLHSDGSFNSITNTVTWNAASAPQLLSIPPGQSGSVNFSVEAKQAFPIRLLSDKNYTVSVSAKMTSPTVPTGIVASGTISVANLTTKFGGMVALDSAGYFRAPSGGFADSGPYPPKANQPTQYNIDWSITNYATDVANVTITSSLQSGTTCTGQMNIPSSTTFVCDPSTGQLTWTIPAIAATTGITGAPLKLVFQVVNTPAVNEISQDVTLVGPATLTATDEFTSSTLQASASLVSTQLPNDTSVPSGENRAVSQ